MTSLNTPRKKSPRAILPITLLLLFAAAAGTAYFLFFEGDVPTVEITAPERFLGTETIISISATDPQSGLRRVRATLRQGEQEVELFSETMPRIGYTGMVGKPEFSLETTFKPDASGFSDGPATLAVQAWDYSARGFLKGNATEAVRQLEIDTAAPRLSILHSERYISPGGSGLVIYRIDDQGARHGLLVNGHFNPGFPIGDGRDDTCLAFFGLPYDTEALETTTAVAEDGAGNRTEVSFSPNFKPTSFKQDRINVGDDFLNRKIPEFEQSYPEMQGDQVQKYLYTNNEVRQLNNARISSLCQNPSPQRFWNGRFLRMAGSNRAGFADHRTYYYQGEVIDRQVHLGIDIASTRNAEVRAANGGIVIFADYLGIYGNMVMLDHGQGVFSLYSHLSQIEVAVGDQIEQDIVLGLTGTSGMAGGDHLHFSMLVNGVFVTPKEWWDQNWINVTIEDPLTESRFR